MLISITAALTITWMLRRIHIRLIITLIYLILMRLLGQSKLILPLIKAWTLILLVKLLVLLGKSRAKFRSFKLGMGLLVVGIH